VLREEINLKYDDTKFSNMLRTYSIKRVFLSVDFLFSLPLGLTFAVLAWYFGIAKVMIYTICPVFIAVSATMIAMAIAGLAIVVSMSDPRFIRILKKADVYENILFAFRFSTGISSLSIIINVLTFSVSHITCEALVLSALLFISAFLMSYSIFSVILLVGTTMRYGIYRGAFLDNETIE
jgi:hypothetical protein